MSSKNDLPEFWLNDGQMPLLPIVSLVIPMHELVPVNPFEKPGQPIVIDLLEYDEKAAEDDNDSEEDKIILAKVEQTIEEEAPAFGAEVFREGHQSGIKIVHQENSEKMPLHLAARRGDLQEIKKLLKQGNYVDLEDHNSSTALHVAALCGKTDAAILLLQHGANIHDLSYEGLSIVQVAIEHGHYDTASALIHHGKFDPNQKNARGESAINMLFLNFKTLAKSAEFAAGSAKAIGEMQKILTAFENFAAHSGKFFHCSDSFIGENQSGAKATYYYDYPMSMQLKIYAPLAPNKVIRDQILQTAEKIYAIDKSEDAFIMAKNILNVFPTGNAYHVKVGHGKKIIVNANGHFKLFTTELAKKSLAEYAQKVQQESNDPLKVAVFERLKDIYENAHDFLSKIGEKATFDHYFSLYEQGKTILIPSGWDGHFVTLFASLPQKIVGVGNSGERYAKTPSGTTFYETSDKLDPQFIKEVVFNQSKQHFEHDKMIQYGIIEQVGSIAMPQQKYGNCSWESHRDAIEGMILVELMNLNPGMKNSVVTAHQYFTEWDHFHGIYQLQEYQSTDPILPVSALIDIFNEVHHKSKQGKLTEQDQSYATKIIETLVSPDYKVEFSAWLEQKGSTESGKLIKQLFANYHFDVTEKAAQTTKMTDKQFDEAISNFKAHHALHSEETHSAQSEHPQVEHTPDTCVAPTLNSLLPTLDAHQVETF